VADNLTRLFVFCADTHLADGAWSSRPAIYGDSYRSFTQIIDYCLELNLPLVIGGDVLDVKRNLAAPVQKLCEQMARMKTANLPVYYTQGQHELDRNITWMSVHPWPKHVNETAFELNGVKLWGIDWLPRRDIQEAFKRVPPDTDMLVCHQVWKDLMKNIGRPECELSDVHYVQHVLTGDFHVRTIETATNAQGLPVKLYSPGSTCMQDISESADKSVYAVCRSGEDLVTVQLPLVTRKFKAYALTTTEMLDEFCKNDFRRDLSLMTQMLLPEEISKPLIRVKFDKRLPDAHLRISNAVGKEAHLFCDALVDKSRGEEETNRVVAQNDLLDAVGDLLADQPIALKLATALLAAENASTELDRQFAEFQETINAAVTAGG